MQIRLQVLLLFPEIPTVTIFAFVSMDWLQYSSFEEVTKIFEFIEILDFFDAKKWFIVNSCIRDMMWFLIDLIYADCYFL